MISVKMKALLTALFLVLVLIELCPFAAAQPDTPGAESQVQPSLWDKVKATGLTGWILFFVSICGLAFGLERAFNLRRERIVPYNLARTADELWNKHEYDKLLETPGAHDSALGRIIRTMVKNRKMPVSDLSAMVGDLSSREMKMHLQRAYPLAIVATVSPLLGLMGTVFGMIGAFDAVAHAKTLGDPSIMAGSISYALMTTAIGLVIAVPSLAAYHFFRIRTNLLALTLEEQVNGMMVKWFLNGEQ